MRFLKGGEEQPLDHYGVAASDSTNFYQISAFPRPGGGSSMGARIGPGDVPFGLSDPKYILLWYAFGSSCYFQSLEQSFVNPPTVLLGEAQYAKDFRVLASWQLHDSIPHLPKMIAFDGSARHTLKADQLTAPVWHFTNCTLVVQEFTNVGDLVLPKLIVAKYFGSNSPNHARPVLLGGLDVHMTSFQRWVSVDTFRPAITKETLISDMRTISSNTPFGIASRELSSWPRLEVSQAKAQSLASGRRHSSATRERLGLVRFVLIVVILAPGVWFGLRRLGTNKERNPAA